MISAPIKRRPDGEHLLHGETSTMTCACLIDVNQRSGVETNSVSSVERVATVTHSLTSPLGASLLVFVAIHFFFACLPPRALWKVCDPCPLPEEPRLVTTSINKLELPATEVESCVMGSSETSQTGPSPRLRDTYKLD